MTHTAEAAPLPSTERWLWTAAGGALLLAGLRARPLLAALLGLGGAWVVYQAQSGRRPVAVDLRSSEGVELDEQLHVRAQPPQVFAFWRDFSHLSALLPGVEAVEDPGGPVSRWTPTAAAPVDVEITELHPERLIAWRSRPGSAWALRGRVTVRAAAGGGTDLRVQLSYPGGPASGWGPFRRSAQQQVLAQLRRLENLLG